MKWNDIAKHFQATQAREAEAQGFAHVVVVRHLTNQNPFKGHATSSSRKCKSNEKWTRITCATFKQIQTNSTKCQQLITIQSFLVRTKELFSCPQRISKSTRARVPMLRTACGASGQHIKRKVACQTLELPKYNEETSCQTFFCTAVCNSLHQWLLFTNYILSHREPLVQSVSAEGRDEGITPSLPDKYLHSGAVAVRGWGQSRESGWKRGAT